MSKKSDTTKIPDRKMGRNTRPDLNLLPPTRLSEQGLRHRGGPRGSPVTGQLGHVVAPTASTGLCTEQAFTGCLPPATHRDARAQGHGSYTALLPRF